MHSTVVNAFATAVLRGHVPSAAKRRRAFAAPLHVWQRVLGFEGCAVQFAHALVAAGMLEEAPPALRLALRDGTSTALRNAMLVHRQLPPVAALAAAHGIRVLVLKGAARLLGGEPAGGRSIADIDLLAAPDDARRLHALLQSELGYAMADEGAAHHLPGLTRPGCLGIEVHHRLSPDRTPLDTLAWNDARPARIGPHSIDIPSPTVLLLHALDHAIGVNWLGRYRLRDICDVAALCAADVSLAEVDRYVRASPERRALETLLSAAHGLEPRAPLVRRGAWTTVRRVSATRIAFAMIPRGRLGAERLFRYAGVLAEGSPRTIWRAGLELVSRRWGAWAADLRVRVGPRGTRVAVAALLALSACSDPSGGALEPLPSFVFTSDAQGARGLYRFENGEVARLSAPDQEDFQAHSAAGSIVFTSRRDGNAEIYIAGLTLGGQRRLTEDPWSDTEPVLDPTGARIAFVTNRSGTPRLWMMGSGGDGQAPLETGSASFVPEGSPAWRPSGDRIAFTSTRTGTSQVFVMELPGGPPVQVTREATGAFLPAWSGDGASILYTTSAGAGTVRVVPWGGGDWRALAASDGALSDGVCHGGWCLAVADGDGGGDIVSVRDIGRAPQPVVSGASDQRDPAVLGR